MALLLDTCALIFYTSEDNSSQKAAQIVDDAYRAGEPLFVSPISAWEIGQLASRRKISLPAPPRRWFESAVRLARLELVDLTPDILIASSFLPDSPLRDPGDKIIAATAREHDFIVLTRDKLMLKYAEMGHMRAMVC